MSASLVGSEMCIRDRTSLSAARTLEELGFPQNADPRSRGAAQSGAPPVSYTHLTLPTICSV
eukprot:184237-Alexandrium_andersonii.AAC.1